LFGGINRRIARLIDADVKLVRVEKLALVLSRISIVSTNVDRRE